MKENKQKKGTEKIIPFRPRIKKTTNTIKKGVKAIRIGFNPNEPNYFTIA
jgi:hypothetical protein